MPMTIYKPIMHAQTEVLKKPSYVEKIRNQYNTEDVNAIMGRFFRAVSWRNE